MSMQKNHDEQNIKILKEKKGSSQGMTGQPGAFKRLGLFCVK